MATRSKNRIRNSYQSFLCEQCNHDCLSDPVCQDCPLKGMRVAIIGGVERMESIYRDVVSQLGGKLSYHGGHTRNGCGKLKKLVSNADMAVFLTSVNSHSALATVKDACKKSGTPLAAIREKGAGSLEKALRNLAGA